jgi:hypothetical protein
VRLFIREKILIVEKTHDKKKEEVKPKISGEINVSTQRKNANPHIFRQNVLNPHIFALLGKTSDMYS